MKLSRVAGVRARKRNPDPEPAEGEGTPPAKELWFLRCAQDFGSRLSLRLRLLTPQLRAFALRMTAAGVFARVETVGNRTLTHYRVLALNCPPFDLADKLTSLPFRSKLFIQVVS